MFETAYEFVSENWVFVVAMGVAIPCVAYYIYTAAGKNKFWHKF